MSEPIFYTAAIGTASAIFKRLGIAQTAQTQGMLYQLATLVLEAIQATQPHKIEQTAKCVCPRCLKLYRTNRAFLGRNMSCLECGQRWCSPHATEVN
jgi:hypothetical protein